MQGYQNLPQLPKQVSVILPETEMEYSPEDDGAFFEVKREKEDSRAGEKGDKRGVINRVNRE